MKDFKMENLYPINQALELPRRTGLFGTLLSAVSLSLLGDQEKASFKFKASIQDRNYILEYGMPYEYRNDGDYAYIVRKVFKEAEGIYYSGRYNIILMSKLQTENLVIVPNFLLDMDAINYARPICAPIPQKEETEYLHPAYILWKNDKTLMSFFGSPEDLEFPKDVLRKTEGHPQPNIKQMSSVRSAIFPKKYHI